MEKKVDFNILLSDILMYENIESSVSFVNSYYKKEEGVFFIEDAQFVNSQYYKVLSPNCTYKEIRSLFRSIGFNFRKLNILKNQEVNFQEIIKNMVLPRILWNH
ncbi:MAG: hypothetical protein HRT67_13310 [Flavobacteriaceae bacterium]|nr:hypothetical protein [Flavobacteriaceae bacterium]